MAKLSFARHPFRWIREKILGPPERKRPPVPPPPPSPPPPPPPGPGPGVPSGLELDSVRVAIWNEVTGDDARYPSRLHDVPEWWDLYLDTGTYLNRNYTQVNYFWGEFLRAFWLNSQEDGSVPREDFYDDAGTVPGLVDWERWRELKKTP